MSAYVWLRVCLRACLSACLSVCLSIYLSLLSTCLLPISRSGCQIVWCLSACLSDWLFFSLSIYLSIYLSVYLSTCLCRPVSLSVCQPISLSVAVYLSWLSACLSVFPVCVSLSDVHCLPAGANLHECLLSVCPNPCWAPIAMSSDKISTCIQYSIVAYSIWAAIVPLYVCWIYVYLELDKCCECIPCCHGQGPFPNLISLGRTCSSQKRFENIPVHSIQTS